MAADLNTITKIAGAIYGQALRDQREQLVERRAFHDRLFGPDYHAAALAEVDELIAIADRAAGRVGP